MILGPTGVFGEQNRGNIYNLLRPPDALGLAAGSAVDLEARVTRRSFPTSSIRVRKFCATMHFATSITNAAFVTPVSFEEGLRRTEAHK